MVLKIHCNEYFPADMILLNSSAPKGICYIETKNLDGETNLKHKNSNKEILHHCRDDREACSFHGHVTCDRPNDKIYQFEGVMDLKGEAGTRVSLSYDNFLLRGSSLRNTDYIYGVVTYPGHDTKIMRNSTGSRSKLSQVERLTNIQILFIFLIQLSCCLVATIYGTLWLEINLEQTKVYLAMTHNSNWAVDAIARFGTWILIFTNIVPISLMVTLEVVKFVQAFFI